VLSGPDGWRVFIGWSEPVAVVGAILARQFWRDLGNSRAIATLTIMVPCDSQGFQDSKED